MNDTSPVTTPTIASLDQDLGADAASVIRSLAALLHDDGRVSDVAVLADGALARGALGSTVPPGGIAMPHARSHAVATQSVAVARLPEPVTFSAGAEPVR